ncbi:hypothetical protein [Paludibacterium purpuratum]|uniref:Uncharacterized protein n=1 Tax=Paludibacterium purpuratum TaxID=1144873 RepID=A0A4R7BB75_9NEIS|nr:hypothetical protein [Paludibacterium purpuratum]TDR82204.1 hypothetical protein DFP86_102318 [Paludibacterium purpuratum]
MNLPRETIYAALFARLAAIPTLVTTSRKLRHWSDVQPAEQPALFQAQKNQRGVVTTPGAPTKWTLPADVYLYAWAPDDQLPSSIINSLLDAVEAALVPDNPMTGKCTLGGLVEHVYLDGEIETDGGVLGNQAIAIIPINIVTT